jgi:hypothetical protein
MHLQPKYDRPNLTRRRMATIVTDCRCGCGAVARHWFVSGHDAKLWAVCLQRSVGDYREATELYRSIRDGEQEA